MVKKARPSHAPRLHASRARTADGRSPRGGATPRTERAPPAQRLIQSLERGLQVMELLADGGPLSATAIARHLGIHQSSASRLLGVLLRAGFVRKPAYHSFALDYGALAFAGRSMGCFPAIGASVEVCNRIARETGYDATVGLLWKGHLLYLTRTNADSSLVLIENSSFPIHESSLGLFLSWEQGKKECLHAVRASLIACGQDPRRAEGIYRAADSTIARHGFLYLENTGNNLFNASLTFELDGRRAALAVFSSRRRAASEKARSILEQGIGFLHDRTEKEKRHGKHPHAR